MRWLRLVVVTSLTHFGPLMPRARADSDPRGSTSDQATQLVTQSQQMSPTSENTRLIPILIYK